jgi:hypothetical protein
VVFTLPRHLSPLALQNKREIYALLFRASAETLIEIARDPKHLGAEIGFFSVLHTWNQKLQHHPHVHCVVPTGGLAPDHSRWIDSQQKFFLPVDVLKEVFRGQSARPPPADAVTVPESVRRFVAERAGRRCEYCLLHERDSYTPHQVDHILSQKHAGSSDPENLAWACIRCNAWKGSDISSIDPETGQLVALFIRDGTAGLTTLNYAVTRLSRSPRSEKSR